MSVTPLSVDNIQCNRPPAERSLPSKYVPQMPSSLPQRKQSVFVAPSGLSQILCPPPLPPPPNRCSPPKKSSLPKPKPKPNAQILEQHISKIISENAAIVETLDPLWSKRYISRNSTSNVPNFAANGLSVATNHMPAANETTINRRFSEGHSNQPLSKLQSALLGKSTAGQQTSPPNRKYSEFCSNEGSKQSQSVITNCANDGNNCVNTCNNDNNNNNNVLNSNNNENSDSIVRNLLTTKTPAIQVTPPDKSSHPTALGVHPQNPEGSIIKDLLLKSRDEAKKSRIEATTAQVAEQESSMLVYVCTVCNIAFRNKENLEVHQVHYCKGNDDRPAKHKMEDLVQRKVSIMARPGFGSPVKHYQHSKQSSSQPFSQQPHQMLSAPTPPVGNILKQQLLAPNQGPPLKKRKISEPVFRNNSKSLSDMQSNEEHSVRRISVVQSTYSSTTKSNHALETETTSLSALSASLPSISTSHTVIQPVLHSGATVIENYLSSHTHKSIPFCVNNYNSRTTHMTTSTQQPVLKSGTDLVNSRVPIEILPAYLPHLKRPETKITFKGPIVFPVLKKFSANGSDPEFTVDESDVDFKSDITATTTTTTCAFRQVASLPMECIESEEDFNSMSENDSEIEILDKDKENDRIVTPVSPPTPTTVVVLPKTTGAVRPRTLSLRTNNCSNLISSTLVSPDTPRPNKSCVELFMNGHAYSRIGLKVTPRPVYCTIYKTQPMFIQQDTNPTLSMYSNWTLSPLAPEDVMNLASAPVILGLNESGSKRRVDSMVMTSAGKTDLNSTHSSYWQFRKSDEEKDQLIEVIDRLREDIGENVEEVYRKLSEEVSASSAYSGDTDSDGGGDVGPPKRVRIFEGGFKSNEDYTYVRGRGRGKYVCEECGIRCKKPSMLKKHIRTHTDLRPYSCRHCAFAFKTKGNLTKHMKSKAHHKKCVELGIIPVPITIDDSQIDTDALAKQEMLEISCGGLPEDEDEDEDEGEWDEDEEEEDDEGVPIPLIELQRYEMMAKSAPVVPGQFDDADMDNHNRALSESGSAATEAEEQEAARSLLILSGSGSESDLTNPLVGSRKTSNVMNEDIVNNSPTPEKRKVSVIDRRISQQVMEEQQRRLSAQVLEAEHHRRVSQQVLEVEETRRISQQMDQNIKQIETDFRPSVVMKPPTDPPIPLLSSPRKLSPIEQLQHQVQQQQQHLLQSTWTPNCDQSRPRSFSFNDVPLVPSNNPSVFASTSRIPIEPIEAISDESSDESLDSFAARRYSMSVIGDRRFDTHPKPPASLSSIAEREEPMDLSLSAKPNEVLNGVIMPSISQSNAVSNITPTPLRQGEFIPTAPQRHIIDSIDGKSICSICSKQFSKPSQLRLHINIHYFERPFRCDSCAVSFRTKGHLQKHKRSVSHFNKVNMNMTFGTPTTDNPRPFKCGDCKIAFRIHGHLAKHLRSKMHIMKLECLGKLPFGMYAEMERSGVNLNEIDTTDCENSLQSLQLMAQRLYDPRQMRWASEPVPEGEGQLDDESMVKDEPNDSYCSSDRGNPPVVNSQTNPLVAKPTHPDPLPSPPQMPNSPPIQASVPPTVAVPQQSGFTPTRSNTCHLCGRLFKGAKFLQVHLYCDHSEDSPQEMDERNDVECDICHKVFNEVSVLQQHLLTHTAARPYVCDMCDAGFTSSPLLASHLQSHHSFSQKQLS